MIHIIGAGPSGISLAYYASLLGHEEINLYEQSDCFGGMARSWKHHDFILDTGPHIYHTDDKDIEIDWKEIGEDLLVQGEFNSCNILSDFPSKLFHYPLSLQTLSENLNKKEFEEIIREIDDLDKNDYSRSASNFKEFMEAKVGQTLTRMFFTEYPQKVWGLRTEKMLADWAPQRIELRKKNFPFYKKPFVAVGLYGTGCFYERIINKLSVKKNFRVFKKKKLTGILSNQQKILKLIFNDKHEVSIGEGDHVISTIPATNFAKLFKVNLDLRFRGVRSQYLFFKNPRILPKGYNWVYCSDKNVSFNRITEPSSMSHGVAPKGYSFLCLETTFESGNYTPNNSDFDKSIKWLNDHELFCTKGYSPELNTENFEGYVYPIQDEKFKTALSSYNSLIAKFSNLSVLGTGGEFHYSDMQIIFRKSRNIIESLLKTEKIKNNSSIPLIKNINKEIYLKLDNKNVSENLSLIHSIAKVKIPLIAEIGINHNGDMNLAKKMMIAAKRSGANFAKFQYYKKNVRVKKNHLTEYLHETADYSEMSLNDIFERSRLDLNNCIELIEYGNKINMPVFFTVFDSVSAFEINDIGQKIVKVASMDCNNIKLHKTINELNFKSVIISTGMSTFPEIERTISLYENKEILLMSCRSTYPAKLEDIDLGEIPFLSNKTNTMVGFSDHTEGDNASLLAVALGAKFIERHFTINKNLSGPDNIMSINELETMKLSKNLQTVSDSIERNQKIIHPSEQNTFNMQKKSLRFKEDKKKGDIIHTDDLISVAPPQGFSLFQSDLPRTFLKIRVNVQKGEPVSKDNIEIMET